MTAIATLPSAWATLHEALQTRRPVWVTYHTRRRLLCPHALGWKTGRAMVLGYQTGGDTTSGTLDPNPRKRWRVLYLDQIDSVTATHDTNHWATADNYNPTHPFPTIDELFTAIPHDPSPARR